MRIFTQEKISSAINIKEVIETVKNGFISHYKGQTSAPDPMQFLFKEEGELIGDCHVKGAQSESIDMFAVKVASGFYNNSNLNLPTNNGLVLLFSSITGQPEALLQDEGLLTSACTAAAGALAAGIVKTNSDDVLGIIGSGEQAKKQAIWICKYLGLSQIRIWARSQKKSHKLAKTLNSQSLNCSVAETTTDLCEECRIVVTTTPSTTPVLYSKDIVNSTHIVAIGADSPGKQELDPEILKRANIIITDDHIQCLNHGEFGAAIRETYVLPNSDVSLGSFLSTERKLKFNENTISVVDLTGMGIQDLAIATLIYQKISKD